ncbi:hypothetical protein BFU36_07605 [Sulfolobus sp. A20]|nr:hypothetical protein BFU36_07605 [Sulfolobus sp. A20]TRM76525.1 hypothetical protein DJ532_07395 [Sulfolobus sp. A20-N-F8]TRM80704.1 hypothetical protein DJ524_06680 [Sulfolobus sp. D5]TRM83871.1 hypothetical protein DJ531_03190 [Sulfolobus sp. A20-N-F6]TRM88312.1 hypothetical protein DJ521_02120 [Sulfolobus sp. E3]TRM89466.1 hypothetical protein DJ529_01985 [Sulfolobus sp. C3]TRM92842.1 hypothetical protein DJ526_05015 [Sulfolobus sp. A20-N-G8]TRM97554.1 hypothetical protein DMP16_02125 
MVLEHALIGTLALIKHRTVNRKIGVPLAIFEMIYYSFLLITFLNFSYQFISITIVFLLIHFLGGFWYIFDKLYSYNDKGTISLTLLGREGGQKKLYTVYSFFEFGELIFLLYILFLSV